MKSVENWTKSDNVDQNALLCTQLMLLKNNNVICLFLWLSLIDKIVSVENWIIPDNNDQNIIM